MEPPTERFTVTDLPNTLQDWLTLQGSGRNVLSVDWQGRRTLVYYGIEGQHVEMEFALEPGALDVTASLFTPGPGVGRQFDGDPVALAEFKTVCDAARKRFAPEQGARAGTLERVRECHRLVKDEHYSLRDALKKAKTHYDTYQRYCMEATNGEKPYTRE